MTLSQLEYFYEAAKTQHFNKAADNLRISQPSLSRAISSLENEFGIVLFERTGRNVTLTKAGQIFLEHTEKILDDIAVAERRMHQLSSSGGEISIAYVSPLSTRFIPQVVKAFVNSESSNKITFNFYQDISYQNIAGLKSGKYDIIFGTKDENESSIRFVPLMKQEMVVIMPKGHELEQQPYVTVSALNEYPLLGYDHTSGLGKYSHDFFRRYSLSPQIICESPDEIGIASLVAEGFGIALVADVGTIHRPDISIRHLVPSQQFYHTVYMGYMTGKYQIPAVSRFIHFVQNYRNENEINRTNILA